jgi:Flp pilus assembly protein TadG
MRLTGQSWRDRIQALVHDRRGNFAMAFAAMIIPMLGAVGLAVDYSRATSTQSYVQDATDAAVLAAVVKAQADIRNGMGQDRAFRLAKAEARRVFIAGLQAGFARSPSGFVLTLTQNGAEIEGRATYNGTVETSLMKIVGIKKFKVASESVAAVGWGGFVEVHLVFDVSASMGVGATTADHRIMDSTVGCAFACHTTAAHEPSWGSTHQTVRAAGAELRIDVVKAAAAKLVRDLRDAGHQGRALKFAVHTFSNNLRTTLRPTPDLGLVGSAIDAVELTNANLQGGTNFEQTLDELARAVPRSGDGSTELSPRRIVLFMTDGMETNIRFDDSLLPSDYAAADPNHQRGIGAWAFTHFDGAACSALKDRNKLEVHTLNVEYAIPTVGTHGDGRFADIERYYLPDIAQNMHSCASSTDKSYVAKSNTDLMDTMDVFKGSIVSSVLKITK